MGYDMYVRNPGEPQPEVNWSDDKSIAEYRDWSERWYFRRNIWGGARLAEALVEMDMGFDAYEYGRPPEWPDSDEYGIDFDDEGEPVGERAQEWHQAQDAVLDWHGPEIPGIPTHKVAGSNDGWHVTREEARAALGLYERALAAGKPHPEAFGDDFIPFLRRAAEADGFETH